MVLLELCLLLITLIAIKLVFWYRERQYIYRTFERCGIKFAKPSLLFGNLRELHKHRNADKQIEQWLNMYGNVFGYFDGGQPILVVNDVEFIKEIFIKRSVVDRQEVILDVEFIKRSLIFVESERWRALRKMISPTFSLSKVTSESISTLIDKCVERCLNAIKTNNELIKEEEGKKIFTKNIYPTAQAYTLDVIAETSLDVTTDTHSPDNQLMNAVREFFEHANNPAVHLALCFSFLKRILTFVNNYCTAGRMTDMIVKNLRKQINLVLENRGNKENNKTIDHGIGNKKENFLKSLLKKFADKYITENEFIGNILVVILAGYETTANAITFTLYLLAMHKDIQERLRDDIKKNGFNSEYLEMVWMESLRLFPPVLHFVRRKILKDIEINGIKIEKNTVIHVPVWQIHHSEQYWQDAEKFDPERFSPENRKTLHPVVYMPFGLGPRMCLGNHLAFYEFRKLIACLITEFKIELDEERTPTKLPLKMDTVIINPDCPVYLKFTSL